MTTPNDTPLHWVQDALESLDADGLRRHLRTRRGPQRATIELDGRSFVHFGSNDYLGLAADARITDAVRDSLATVGWGTGASPLITGHTDYHKTLENHLATFEGTEAACLFVSGFAANAGTIPTLVNASDIIFADSKNHASLIDACRLSRATISIYEHCDVQHLESLLRNAPEARRRLIVTDSLFSMDGDFAPLVEIAALRERYGCMLLVDEAHATGVFGPNGRGISELLGVESAVDIKVGTLSKAVGCAGGFVCGSASLIEWLINRARSYIFSTSHPAATAAAADAAMQIIQEEPFRRSDLLAKSTSMRERLRSQGWDLGTSESQIIPIRIGSAKRAVAASRALSEEGFFVPAIRPPSVPDGECCLRLSVTYDHSEEMLQAVSGALQSLRSLAV